MASAPSLFAEYDVLQAAKSAVTPVNLAALGSAPEDLKHEG